MDRALTSKALRALGYLAVAAALVIPFVPGFFRSGAPLDEGLLLAYPEFMSWGARPGMDFVHPYGPGSLWLLRAFYDVFGVSLLTERAVGLGFRLAIIAGVFAVSYARGRVLATGAALLAALVLSPVGVAASAWFGAIASLIWALWLLGSPGILRCLAGGALLGVTLTIRTDLAIAAAVSSVPLLLGMRRDARLLTFAGGAAATIPLVLHVREISLRGAYRSMIVEPMARAPAHFLALPRDFQTAWFFLITTAAALLMLLAAIRTLRRRSSDVARMDLALALLAVTLIPHVLQRVEPIHITYAACVSIPLLPRVLAGAFELRQALAPLAVAIALIIGAPTLIGLRTARLVLAGVGLRTIERGARVEHAGRWFLIDDAARAEQVHEILGELRARATAGDRLFVGPRDPSRPNYNDTYVFFLVPELRPSSYYAAVVPGITILPTEIARADFLILTTAYDWRGPAVTPNREQLAAARIIAEEFCPAARRGEYELLQRC